MSAAVTYAAWGVFIGWLVYQVSRDLVRYRRATREPVSGWKPTVSCLSVTRLPSGRQMVTVNTEEPLPSWDQTLQDIQALPTAVRR